MALIMAALRPSQNAVVLLDAVTVERASSSPSPSHHAVPEGILFPEGEGKVTDDIGILFSDDLNEYE